MAVLTVICRKKRHLDYKLSMHKDDVDFVGGELGLGNDQIEEKGQGPGPDSRINQTLLLLLGTSYGWLKNPAAKENFGRKKHENPKSAVFGDFPFELKKPMWIAFPSTEKNVICLGLVLRSLSRSKLLSKMKMRSDNEFQTSQVLPVVFLVFEFLKKTFLLGRRAFWPLGSLWFSKSGVSFGSFSPFGFKGPDFTSKPTEKGPAQLALGLAWAGWQRAWLRILGRSGFRRSQGSLSGFSWSIAAVVFFFTVWKWFLWFFWCLSSRFFLKLILSEATALGRFGGRFWVYETQNTCLRNLKHAAFQTLWIS